ncbi:ABC transporter ATP-binding protein [Paenibacillus turpanensis]|uniref:ABC transporter ATP-binding protein n=1 Tax=Paenibacillus turpanensis TaxID=2689078 RepID=UPI0014078B76|nr:ABC transporter ATP-binding protein [Paenibacillus turpanensis]
MEFAARIDGVSKRYGGAAVLQHISFEVKQGELLGIIGPNGSGKSTLLKVLSGVDQPDAGGVEVGGRPVAAYSRKELARYMSVLQQEPLPLSAFTVNEVVEMGRYPFQNWLGEDTPSGAHVVEQLLERLGLVVHADKRLSQLSGGERQRVALAKSLAQEPKLLLLDEPTTFLDIGYQVQMMDFVSEWQHERGLTVVAVLHELNIAAQYCDRLIMMNRGEIAAAGKPDEVLGEERIEEVYGTRPIVLQHPVTGKPQVLLQGGKRE